MRTSCPIYFGSIEVPLPLLLAAATLLGVIIPLIFNKVFLSRRDRNEDDQRRFENSTKLLTESSAHAADLEAAIAKVLKKPTPSADDVRAIMKAGEIYIATQRSMAHAVLHNLLSDTSKVHDFVPRIVEALEKSLPAYYSALPRVCKKVGIPFEGKFTEDNYETLFRVAELYDHAAWTRVRAMLASGAS